MQLVIVESPAKAKTINKYLGSDYKVLASYGHVRDLPPKDGSVLPDDDFRMLWEVSADRSKQLRAISDEAKNADTLILATDPDREGEAISWHLYEWLKGKRALPKDVQRVTFNEITKGAILTAMKAPRQLDQELVDAYLARRALDYLVGFTLSPVLWRKLPGAKSAGRVQSVALRLIVDREREIETFDTREFWTVDADMASPAGAAFGAKLITWQGKKLDKFDLGNAAVANEAKADVLAGRYKVATVETKPVMRNPYPPFTTSTLQQEAARKLGMTATQTMRVAQQLYEEGVITYMRTDGVTIAGEAIAAAREVIGKRFGAASVPDKPRVYTSKQKNAQEAHEAIRPTEMSRAPEGAGLSGEHKRLYDLIWKRTMASQMASARLERTSVDMIDEHGRATLRATGQVVLFPGFLALYQEDRDEPATDEEDGQRLPKLAQGDAVKLEGARAEQHFTQPPPRYSEASLVKKLEELGIGRPSTYASILQTLRDRAYVRAEKNRFHPEEKGRLVTAFLERFFEKYVSYDFTAGLEEQLDEIAGGDIDWKTVLRDFWKDFQPKTEEIIGLKPSEVTLALDEFLAPYLFPEKDGGDPRRCPACGDGRLSLRGGKFGSFIACSNYPNCRYTRPFGEGEAAGAAGDSGPKELGIDPESQEPVTLRSGRFGLFVQRGESEKPPRASLPRDVKPEDLDLAFALRLLSLPRTIGTHPETGLPITASIGRYGPYLAHDGKYAKLTSTADVFETGMNAAVVKLAEPRGGKFERKAPAALREIGAHPVSGAAIRLMEGRFGPYVTDGTTNATVPKSQDIQTLSLDDAAALIDARAAAGPSKKGGRGRKAPAKASAKAPAKAAAKKKPAAKKAPKKA